MEKKCFVVMGFNERVDPVTGRVLDLNKTYRGIIKPAAEAAGFECFRADEIQHAGLIDVPMYRSLLEADLVIADLSTLNPNAFFELGVRYALKSRKTIVIAEKGFVNPFDTNHISMHFYQHDGLVLDFEVVDEFKAELTELIKAVDAAEQDDSPVFEFLGELQIPGPPLDTNLPDNEEQAAEPFTTAYSVLIDQARELRAEGKFSEMATLLEAIRVAQGDDVDAFIVHQLALAYYKSEKPCKRQSLEKARKVLEPLCPEHALDAETIGLWGAVHKRLAELPDIEEAARKQAMNSAIDALSRGFFLLHDYYNGINAAFLLDVRASLLDSDDPEAIADRVFARRIRTIVKSITNDLLSEPIAGSSPSDRIEKAYWIEATKVEALFGLGHKEAALQLFDEIKAREGIEAWMIDSTTTQLEKLSELI